LRLGERLAPLIACRVSRGTEVEVVVGPSKTSEEWKPYHPVRVVSGPGAGCEGEMESAYLGQR
jgi:hypothetical protein